jgi:hypothetical protein
VCCVAPCAPQPTIAAGPARAVMQHTRWWLHAGGLGRAWVTLLGLCTPPSSSHTSAHASCRSFDLVALWCEGWRAFGGAQPIRRCKSGVCDLTNPLQVPERLQPPRHSRIGQNALAAAAHPKTDGRCVNSGLRAMDCSEGVSIGPLLALLWGWRHRAQGNCEGAGRPLFAVIWMRRRRPCWPGTPSVLCGCQGNWC